MQDDQDHALHMQTIRPLFVDSGAVILKVAPQPDSWEQLQRHTEPQKCTLTLCDQRALRMLTSVCIDVSTLFYSYGPTNSIPWFTVIKDLVRFNTTIQHSPPSEMSDVFATELESFGEGGRSLLATGENADKGETLMRTRHCTPREHRNILFGTWKSRRHKQHEPRNSEDGSTRSVRDGSWSSSRDVSATSRFSSCFSRTPAAWSTGRAPCCSRLFSSIQQSIEHEVERCATYHRIDHRVEDTRHSFPIWKRSSKSTQATKIQDGHRVRTTRSGRRCPQIVYTASDDFIARLLNWQLEKANRDRGLMREETHTQISARIFVTQVQALSQHFESAHLQKTLLREQQQSSELHVFHFGQSTTT